MALIKAKNWKEISIEYWMITDEVYRKKQGITFFQIEGYKNKQARLADVDNSIHELKQTLTLQGKCSTAEGYTAFKNSSFFTGASDDL